MYTAYTRSLYYRNINTLQQLDESGMKISVSAPPLLNVFGNNQTRSDVLRSLKTKLIVFDYKGFGAFERTAEKRDICVIERYSDIQIIIKVNFDFIRLIHIRFSH